MLKGLGNLASLVKQAQQMGGKMQGLADELKQRRATGSAGAGLVEVEVNGLGELLKCRLDDSLIAKQDRELLEDLIVAATNQALAKSKQLHAEAMRGLTTGMNIPGLEGALDEALGKLGDGPDSSGS